MSTQAAGLKRAGFKIAILAGSYLLLVFLIVTIEVVSGDVRLLGWAYLLGSLAYLIGVTGICFRDIEKKHVALFVAILGILMGLIVGLVAGVNFKFLIGGRM